MIGLQNVKIIPVACKTLGSSTNGTFRVDTLGFNYCMLTFNTPVAAATNSSAQIAVLDINESDAADTNTVAVSGLAGTVGTAASSQFVIPVHNDTANPACVPLFINLNGRKRYLQISFTPGASNTSFAINAILSRAYQAPNTNAERGVGGSVFV